MKEKANLFEVQPAFCRAPLPKKEIKHSEWVIENHPEHIVKWERVLSFDPTEIYNRIQHLIDPHQRSLAISVEEIFPSIEGKCSCGCGAELLGRHKRWSTDQCSSFAWDVRNIICNARRVPTKYIKRYFGSNCIECKERPGQELDHIICVKHGGAGGWLSNYRLLCSLCHRAKTNTDFGYKGVKINQLKLELKPEIKLF